MQNWGRLPKVGLGLVNLRNNVTVPPRGFSFTRGVPLLLTKRPDFQVRTWILYYYLLGAKYPELEP